MYYSFSLVLSGVLTLLFCFANYLLVSFKSPNSLFHLQGTSVTSTSFAVCSSYGLFSFPFQHYCSSRWFSCWFILSISPRVSPLLKFHLFFFLLFVQRALSLAFYSLQPPPSPPPSHCLSEKWKWLHPSPIFFSFSLWVVGIYVYGVGWRGCALLDDLHVPSVRQGKKATHTDSQTNAASQIYGGSVRWLKQKLRKDGLMKCKGQKNERDKVKEREKERKDKQREGDKELENAERG